MLKERLTSSEARGLIGLDDRPRPASGRVRIVKGLKRSAPFSSLQRRIIFFNLIGLSLLVAGMAYLSNNKQNLIEVYVDSLRKQGQIIAVSIAEQAATEDDDRLPSFHPLRSSLALALLAQPTGVRIRLYDQSLRLSADTYYASPAGPPIEVLKIAPPTKRHFAFFFERFERVYERFGGYLDSTPKIHPEVPVAGITNDAEVIKAATGVPAHEVRVNSQGEVIVSVAMPVTRLRAVLGVLQLSTVGGAIERFVREEKRAVLEIFFLAAIVSILLSILLANMIASPIRQLARAANQEGANAARPITADHMEIPDLTHRTDEIGDLSDALIRMTQALYARIEAIESFAADVAHEVKNPLTSMRSAIETMQYAKTPEQRQRLLDVIQNDVARMDRLVTDISNASRLDAELVRERMEPFDLGQLIRVLSEVTEQQGADRNVTVETHLPKDGLIARALEGRLAQVITNLLTNALSFAPDGSTITVTGGWKPTGEIRVMVEDEGPGIPPDNLASIFERFYSERPRNEAFGNHSGLGLSISKQIIEAHGGRIWAENIWSDKPGSQDQPLGARFIFELNE